MTKKKPKTKKAKYAPLMLPALQGRFGDWTYYVALMHVTDIADRVSFASDIHKSKRLSELIQRKLEGKRAKQIADYVHEQAQRFFNALVIGVYGGEPEWHAIALRNDLKADIAAGDLDVEMGTAFGVLALSGGEDLFALDGQHRLAGLKEAKSKGWLAEDETLSVVMVAHDKSPAGLARTRRLFTTLNKTAKPVSISERIALDQDDPVAVCTRWAVEEYFAEDAIKAIGGGDNLPPTDRTSFTTVKAIYDALKAFLPRRTGVKHRGFANRPVSDETQKQFQDHARSLFEALGAGLQDLAPFLTGRVAQRKAAIGRQRTASGGHLLFRPVGLVAFVEAASIRWGSHLRKRHIVAALTKLTLEFQSAPFAGVIWDASTKKVDVAGRRLARDLLVHMLGGTVDIDEATLAERLGEDFDLDDLAVLGEVEVGDGEDEKEEEAEDGADEDEEDDDDDEDDDEDEGDEEDEDDEGEDARRKKGRRRG